VLLDTVGLFIAQIDEALERVQFQGSFGDTGEEGEQVVGR